MDLEAADFLALGIFLFAAAVCLLLWGTNRRTPALWVWTAAIVATCVPFADLHLHTHWYKVAWIPFWSGEQKASDVVANILIYMPLGFLTRRRRDAGSRYARAALGSGLLSLACEVAQLYSHSRIPSTTDIASDVIGALLGVAVSNSSRLESR